MKKKQSDTSPQSGGCACPPSNDVMCAKAGSHGAAGLSGILPCPFCGGPSAVVELAGLFRGGCDSCGIWTDSWTDANGAQTAWNERNEWDHARIGSEMLEARKAAGVSVRQLAARMQCSPAYVSDLELGRRCWTKEKLRWYVDSLFLPKANHQSTEVPK